MCEQDRRAIGTADYQGIAPFHHEGYRYLLAGPAEFAEHKGNRTVMKPHRWRRLYRRLHDAYLAAGLDVTANSLEHDAILRRVMRIPCSTFVYCPPDE